MKSSSLGIKYFFSIVIDYIIIMMIIIPVSRCLTDNNRIIFEPLLVVIFLVYLIQDKIFKNTSIGKMIFSLRIESLEKNGKVSLSNVFVRRVLEIMYSNKVIFWRLKINIDKISHTKIVQKINRQRLEPICDTPSKKDIYGIINQKNSLMSLRTKAFLFDFLIISWAILGANLMQISIIRNYVEEAFPTLSLWIKYVLYAVSFLYFILKDFAYGNQSVGKRKVGLEILDLEKKRPSWLQILVRNIIIYGLAPLEILLFLLKKKQICDVITYTDIFLVEKI